MKNDLKILHFGLLKTINPGVKQQLICEQKAPKNLNWHVIFFSHDAINDGFMRQPAYPFSFFKKIRVLKYITLRVSAYSWLLKNADKFDVVVLRYPLGDPLLAFYARKLNNLFTIHHTKELDEIKSHSGFVSKIHQTIESLVSRVVLRQVSGIIGLTREILDYELDRIKPVIRPGFVSSNGIDTTTLHQLKDSRQDNIKLVCICSKPYVWQGLDLIVSDLINSNIQGVELHFIGDISPEMFGSDPRIFYHGMLTKSELEESLSVYDLGLGSFALYRKAMKEACTLKTRDYLAAGIPVYANHTDSGLPASFPFFINQPFDLTTAIKLANDFRKTTKESIRQASLPYIDKQELVEDLADWIIQCTESSSNRR